MTSRLPQHRATAWRWSLVALGIWSVLAGIASIALWHLRSEALGSQSRELRVLSLALTDEIDRGLQGAEEGLHAVRDEIGEGRLPVAGADSARAFRVRAALMPLVRTLWLVDAGSHVLAASDDTLAPALASFVPPLETLPADVIAISRPFVATDNGTSLVALAVAVPPAPAGSPRRWILGSVPATALLGAFTAALPAADARMAVTRGDGARLAGANVAAPRRDEPDVAELLAARPTLEMRRFSDGTERLVALRTTSHFGLRVMVSRDLVAVLAGWRAAAELTAAAFVLLLFITVLAVQLVLRANRRRTEAQEALHTQLARASKLESLGTLAGGVAHDFNNVLAGIVGFGEMAQDAAAPGSTQARHLDRVLKAALRGKALVERILAFSRGGARASTVFALEPVVEEVLTLLSASLRPGVILERELGARDARLRGDPTQAFEAVMNLCTNAMQAMPAGGMVSVQLERLRVDAPRVLSHTSLAPGDYLALSVSDQGGGITPTVMEHLFEPFFTTRGAQRGTGLGLAVVHGVVNEFGGAIDVNSVPGHGARFTLYFPECTDVLAATEAAGAPTPAGAGQCLLVVDDEPMLGALAVELLEGLGYQPVAFADPAAALQALRDDPQRFAAVITDEVMPGMTGTQLTEALRPLAQTMPVLLVTGYGGALLAQRAVAAGVTRVLTKPLQRADLARALAELVH